VDEVAAVQMMRDFLSCEFEEAQKGAQKLLEWLLCWARSSTESLRQLQLAVAVVAAAASEAEERPP
jgi:hypothetical protein